MANQPLQKLCSFLCSELLDLDRDCLAENSTIPPREVHQKFPLLGPLVTLDQWMVPMHL